MENFKPLLMGYAMETCKSIGPGYGHGNLKQWVCKIPGPMTVPSVCLYRYIYICRYIYIEIYIYI